MPIVMDNHYHLLLDTPQGNLSRVVRHLGLVRMARKVEEAMNYPAASCGVSEELDENYPKGVTPECFYRGSSSGFAWIPA